jgi:hypothetical protein
MRVCDPMKRLHQTAVHRESFLEAGETIEARIEGIGTLRHPGVAGKPLPTDLTGAQLPAVGTYRPAGSRQQQ